MNSRNLPAFGSPLARHSTCANLHAGAQILAAGYVKAAGTFGGGQNMLFEIG